MKSDEINLEERIAIAHEFLESTHLKSYSGQRLWNDKEDIKDSLSNGIARLRNDAHSSSVVNSTLSKR